MSFYIIQGPLYIFEKSFDVQFIIELKELNSKIDDMFYIIKLGLTKVSRSVSLLPFGVFGFERNSRLFRDVERAWEEVWLLARFDAKEFCNYPLGFIIMDC